MINGHGTASDLSERIAREQNVWRCTLRPDGSSHVTRCGSYRGQAANAATTSGAQPRPAPGDHRRGTVLFEVPVDRWLLAGTVQ